ncbi:serine carboxypeptidase S28-domain-containing protein [Infundibulicybe gibba]|nr:serine carboxypeptidase S28-domain-containing protein [Infundibulicybe gibba]
MLYGAWAAVGFLISSNCFASAAVPHGPDLIRVLGPQGVNLWKLNKMKAAEKGGRGLIWFTQPLDHFSDTGHTFQQRYWVNSRHYKPDVDGGETSGEDRLPFLDTGIVEILARSTGGVGVVLEHRYYGQSMPVSNLTTDSLRWLNNEQAAADSANFMANVKFDGIKENLTAPGTPWIYYGGSYAGARAAHMKILYPDLVYGAIASSGVTHAAIENWEYMDIIRTAADPKCSAHLVNSIRVIDAILAEGKLTHVLKSLFGLSGLESNQDFASVLQSPLGSWQSKNWDPEVGSTTFDDFCNALSRPFGHLHSAELPIGHHDRMVTVSGDLRLDFSILNYAHWIKKLPSGDDRGRCKSHPDTFSIVFKFYQFIVFWHFQRCRVPGTTLDQDWRLWLFQVCTQWGYFTTAPPDQNLPRIISRFLTLDYESKTCKQAFPPGKYFKVPSMPNITAVNALGDFDIAADRLAIIDGEGTPGPWRPDTPHSEYAHDREDTILRPFKLIPGGVHHYDEYGLPNIFDEPPQIRKIHGEMILFVTEWLKDWKPPKN